MSGSDIEISENNGFREKWKKDLDLCDIEYIKVVPITNKLSK